MERSKPSSGFVVILIMSVIGVAEENSGWWFPPLTMMHFWDGWCQSYEVWKSVALLQINIDTIKADMLFCLFKYQDSCIPLECVSWAGLALLFISHTTECLQNLHYLPSVARRAWALNNFESFCFDQSYSTKLERKSSEITTLMWFLEGASHNC